LVALEPVSAPKSARDRDPGLAGSRVRIEVGDGVTKRSGAGASLPFQLGRLRRPQPDERELAGVE
jgi:hypothetical protein